jgi:cell division protein FtsB
MQKKAEIKDLEKSNADLAKQIEQKRARIKRLEDNPEAQELEIRRQLKLVHPGEKIFNSQDQEKKLPGK